MSTEIYALVEVRDDDLWNDAGEILVDGSYAVYAALGNVRNTNAIPCIGEERYSRESDGKIWAVHPDGSHNREYDPCWNFALRYRQDEDGYGASYALLSEIQAYDLEYTVWAPRQVKWGEMGRVKVLQNQYGYDDQPAWLALIGRMRRVAQAHGETDPEKIRLSFYFH